MKISYLWVVTMGFVLAGCAAVNSVQPVNNQAQNTASTPLPEKNSPQSRSCHKNPIDVSFLNGLNPNLPYSVVGNATVSQYNIAGNKRQEAIIHDAMRSAAASMGGDAIINIKRNDNTVSGTVIAYPPKISV